MLVAANTKIVSAVPVVAKAVIEIVEPALQVPVFLELAFPSNAGLEPIARLV